MNENNNNRNSPAIIPLATDVQRLMNKLSAELYQAWRQEIGRRLRDLEFQGEITKHDLTVPESVWRLPNTEVRKALSRLQVNLKDAGYSYEFRFQDVDDANWILSYVIDLPEREESDDEADDGDVIGVDEAQFCGNENHHSHNIDSNDALSDVSNG